jgi:hypothetical protein
LTGIETEHGASSYGYEPSTGQPNSERSDDDVTTSMTHDGPLLLSSAWSIAGESFGSVARSYNLDWLVESISVNGNEELVYGYDRDGRVTSTNSSGAGFGVAYSLGSNQIEWTRLRYQATQQRVDTRCAYNVYGELESCEAGAPAPEDEINLRPGYFGYSIGARDVRARRTGKKNGTVCVRGG